MSANKHDSRRFRRLGLISLAALTVLALGCGFKKTYTEKETGAFSFEYPSSFATDQQAMGVPNMPGVWIYVVEAKGSGTVGTYYVMRMTGLSNVLGEKSPAEVMPALLDAQVAQLQGPATVPHTPKTRPYGSTERLSFAGTGPEQEKYMVMEGFMQGDEMYMLIIGGDSNAIETDADGESFFNTFKKLK